MRSDIIKSLKESYAFLKDDYGYEIIDLENSSNLIFYVRYENKSLQRIISTSIDLRENSFSLTIWRSANGWTKDEDMLEFKDYLKQNGIDEQLYGMSDFSTDIKLIADINKHNSKVFKRYGVGLIKGEEGYD